MRKAFTGWMGFCQQADSIVMDARTLNPKRLAAFRDNLLAGIIYYQPMFADNKCLWPPTKPQS